MYSIRVGRASPAFIPLVTALLLLAACGGGGGSDDQGSVPGSHHHTTQREELPTVALPARWAWGNAESLGTLISSADVVFSGTVIALKGQRPALSPSVGLETQGEAPRWADFPVSQFELRVENVVSGNLTPGTAVIEQMGGVETRPDGTQVRLMLRGDEPLQVGGKYLFFGSFQKDGSIVAPPFGRMNVRPDGSLAAEAGWEHLRALAQLSRGNLGDAERQISVTAHD